MVSIDGITSNPKPITIGVIQDSVLCTLLFFICINDALNSLSRGVLFLFADDIIIIYHFKSNKAITKVR